jgi:hypothetical protein
VRLPPGVTRQVAIVFVARGVPGGTAGRSPGRGRESRLCAVSGTDAMVVATGDRFAEYAAAAAGSCSPGVGG